MTEDQVIGCKACRDTVESPDTVHVIRTCPSCGRELRVVSPGDHGIGVKVEKGDRLVIPPAALQISLNPLKSAGHFTRSGMQWFWELATVGDMPKQREEFGGALDHLEAGTDELLKASPMLAGFDLSDPGSSQKAFELLSQNKETAEWWAALAGMFTAVCRDAISDGDPTRSAWAAACMERFRGMMIFKTHLEEVVWMGHSAKRIIDLLLLWDANKENGDEEFWQIKFSESTYALSQVLGVPLVFIQDKAYAGGMTLEGKEARLVDYLFAVESSGEAVLIEIKTPVEKLLGPKYRGVYRPASELAGAVIQVLDYRTQLLRKFDSLAKKEGKELNAFSPRCVLIAGNAKGELTDQDRRQSFELFRSSLKDVEIITYDELFRKLEVMATLFNLVRTPIAKNASPSAGGKAP